MKIHDESTVGQANTPEKKSELELAKSNANYWMKKAEHLQTIVDIVNAPETTKHTLRMYSELDDEGKQKIDTLMDALISIKRSVAGFKKANKMAAKPEPQAYPPSLYLKPVPVGAIFPNNEIVALVRPVAGCQEYVPVSEYNSLQSSLAAAQKEIEELEEQNRILAINGNNDEARCVEVGMLQEELSAAQAEVERLSKDISRLKSCWDDIPPLDCRSEGFQDRLLKDRNRRVSAFKAAIAQEPATEVEGGREPGDCKGNKPRFFCVICQSPLYHVTLAQEFRVCSGYCKDRLTKIGLETVQSVKGIKGRPTAENEGATNG